MRTSSRMRVWNRLALTAGMLLFCFGPFVAAQTPPKQPAPKPQQQSGSDPHASQAGPQGAPSPHVIGEDEDFIRQREAWFYSDRSLPDGTIPTTLRLKALEHLEEMIRVERQMGLLPDGLVTPQIDFLGPTSWTTIGPQGILVQPGNPLSGNPLNSGRVAALAVNPNIMGKDVVYMGAAAGGVWKSIDGGAHWTVLTDTQPSLSVGSLVLDPTSCTAADCSTIYVGTGEANNSADSYYGAGVLKSTDGGATWIQTGTPRGFPFVGPFSASRLNGGAHISAIAVDPAPNFNQIILAGAQFNTSLASSGLYRTTNGGTNWALLSAATGIPPGAPATSIVFDPPSNPGVVYAALGNAGGAGVNGVYRSTDHGATWVKLPGTGANLFPTNAGRIALAVVPGGGPTNTTIYAAVANTNGSTFLGVFKTMDTGMNWTLNSSTDICSGQCFYDLAIAVDPVSTNVLFAGGSSGPTGSRALFRSIDGGATWTSVRAGATVSLHVDLHALAFSADGSRLYVGNDGGMWRTDNPTAAPGTLDYVNLNDTLTITMFYPGFAVHQADENVGFGGTQDNGTESFTGALRWQSVTPGDGGFATIDPRISSVVYTSCQFVCIFRSVTDGTLGSFTFRTDGINSGDRSRFIAPLVHDPSTAGRVYFGTFRVYLTTDFAETWTAISPDLTGGSGAITTIAPARSDPNVVYVGTGSTGLGSLTPGRIQKCITATSGCGLAAWTDLTTPDLPPRTVSAIAVDRNNASLVYATFTGFTFAPDTKGHVFRSANGGTTWTDISGTGATAIPNVPANDVLADPDADRVYVATDIGVFRTADMTSPSTCSGAGCVWIPMVGTDTKPLPNVVVLALSGRGRSRILRAATSGRGAFVIQLTNVPIPAGPLLASMNPTSKSAGSAGFTLSLSGAHFLTSTSVVRWKVGATTTTLPTTVVDPSHLTATVDASLLANAAVVDVTVFDPTQTPNESDNLRFSVLAAAPTITTLVPASATTGGPAFTLTVNGTNFNCGGGSTASVVFFRGNRHTPATCSPTQMTVNIAASEIATSGNGNVRVFTPPPGGGDSATRSFPITAPPPPNDDFLQAINATPLPFTDIQDNSGATTDTGGRIDPTPSAACVSGVPGAGRAHTIWYKFIPAATGSFTATTAGSGYDTVLDVVTGSPGAFTEVACNDDVNPPFDLTSKVTFTATAGTTYFFMVAGFDDTQSGTTVFHLGATGAPPPNDAFANAKTASPTPFTDVQDTTGATTEVGEPVPPAACATGETTTATHSIWYKFTPPSNGTIAADTHGSSYDTILQAVTGPGLGMFTPVACNDDTSASDLTSEVSFPATAGTTYVFMVSAFEGDGGSSLFHLTFSGPDYNLVQPSPSTATINAGQSATFTINLTTQNGGLVNAVNFSATGLPAAAAGTFNPASIPAGSTTGSTVFTVTTTARSMVPPQLLRPPPGPVVRLWLVTLALALASLALLRRGFRTRRLAVYLPLALLVLFAAFVVGCGGGGGTPPPSGNGTPAGTYTVTVTATSSGLSHTTTVTLTVN